MSRRRQLLHGGRKDALIANVGDIAYKAANGKIMVVNPDAWSSSLGTPVGVVVIPSGFAPDGKARMLSLDYANSSGIGSTSAIDIEWGPIGTDTPLINYNCVPITDNAGSTTTGSYRYGYLPSDGFTGATSHVDPTAKYKNTSYMIPSPYLGDKQNPAYYAPISGYNNVLADFDGKGNTDVLVALGSDYLAANAARNYKATGAEEIEWYLPAMGELGYMLPRFNKIQAALTKVSASELNKYKYYWSSSEYAPDNVYSTNPYVGDVYHNGKGYTNSVRPFAQLDF